MEKKICTICKEEKKLSEFYKNKNRNNKRCGQCIKCKRKYSEENREIINKRVRDYYKNFPWRKTLSHIKQRCDNPNCEKYLRYGGRGIKCLITADELKELWYRDKAYLMDRPSIDREDSDKNYIYSNCQYIELSENSKKRNRENPSGKAILQYDLTGSFVKEWNSIAEASSNFSVSRNAIGNCLNGKYKTSCGFIWKYKTKEYICSI